ncbi:type II toxin-antitoxin system VapC family toxin [Turneriella parva]|uniref:type II toxin-antitoxin system VapC family toxin n=1 Tax=Turneriella parva TaxID=29510 RepID=UPI001C261B2C|nr:type II toxin-antitoxin system VapC family toxin [Turneriella parva]
MNNLKDTNIAIYQLQNRLVNQLSEGRYFLSVISEIELLAYPGLTKTEEQNIKMLLKTLDIVPLSEAVKSETIAIKRKHQLKLPDAIIVATAKVHKCLLLTNDEHIARQNIVETRACAVKKPGR